MATFTVWKFDSPEGADAASRILHDSASEHAVKIVDTAVVSWPEGAAKPTTRHGHQDEWRGTGWGAFWGLLLGSLFFAPVLGAAAGAAIGASTKAMEAVGIDKDQLDRIREGVTPGTSALFVVTEDGDLDRVGERFHGVHGTLVATNLTDAERSTLLETFG
ncbi:Uncharacterized membrane protein [Cellulosimicrobium aquatile]|mgnify:FL=1|jgi:uncharacterized membrane protein|uniref:DUF1269 domain-containing protein n=2 Tax=Cellulosimicrobium TaxID=157920 RepID=A0A4Y8R414_9MICO|nr:MULTISPECIES: DUF1269 domain-containing protein [Cellulosimicrobium]TGA77398.1 DUF1269 domain-containing protein [Cellulosimicrobium terreum]CPU64262.1 Predicted membrane protein [Mycobacteroides abscessus]ARK03822.1 DUF1269 domain-containing family protein [Cellulosimicrobium sp. TH-20]MBE9938168.1 DUF1269 domain-containing protein [Cellulosimicrobium cellulans]MCM3535359.1 DUF1269 domain-containing protein [Cellulosimicrobium funkei]